MTHSAEVPVLVPVSVLSLLVLERAEEGAQGALAPVPHDVVETVVVAQVGGVPDHRILDPRVPEVGRETIWIMWFFCELPGSLLPVTDVCQSVW